MALGHAGLLDLDANITERKPICPFMLASPNALTTTAGSYPRQPPSRPDKSFTNRNSVLTLLLFTFIISGDDNPSRS
jgi:hypothetical protein